jgi:hypothetical protein
MKKDFWELAVYGIASILSGMLFFFGLMYPDYLYTEEAYRITAPTEVQQVWGITMEEFNELSGEEKFQLISELDMSHIQYKSRLWELLQ